MSRVYTAPSGERLRVIGNNLLVRLEPPPETTLGGIVLPGIEPLYGLGEVVAVGCLTGKRAVFRTPIPDVEVGDYVCFLALLARTDTNPQIKSRTGENLLRIRPADVLLVISASDLQRLR